MTGLQHIVVVDDEPKPREMVGEYLRMHGFAVCPKMTEMAAGYYCAP
jgi:DNA-binding response OmpR family regulator